MFAVTMISNSCRYKRRIENYFRFEEMCAHAGIRMIVVELAFGDRAFEVTDEGNPHHVQLRTTEEFWHKENCLNIGIGHGRKLWPKAKTVCWLDSDCRPARPARDWFNETWHELQHYKFVQMWETLQSLTNDYGGIGTPNPSFMSNYVKFGNPYPRQEDGYPKQWGSPGLAWAANIADLDAIGGLPDKAVLGAGDWYLAHMLVSDLPLKDMQERHYSADYRHYWERIQKLCNRHIKRDVGYVKGLVLHDAHGKIVNRGYNTRENILIKYQFSPLHDLKRDLQGVYQLETEELRQIQMYADIRRYFRCRNEDEII